MLRYVKNVFLGFDQLLNAVFLGDPDETISSRWGKQIRDGTAPFWIKVACGALNLIDRKHCIDAIEDDRGR